MAALREDILESLSTETVWVELRNEKGAINILGWQCQPPQQQAGSRGTDA